MKKSFGLIFFAVWGLVAGGQSGRAQGFVNLNFESANVSGYSPISEVPITKVLLGWTAELTSSIDTNILSQVWYDALSTGGQAISVVDTNVQSSYFDPLQGRYSACLFGGGIGTLYSATISQTGLVPDGTKSLLFDANVYGASFVITLGGQTVDMIPLQTFSNYTEYGGDISSFAGDVETLSFTEPPVTGTQPTQPSLLELDDIQFSPSAVPEPSEFGLLALGGLLFGWRHRKISWR